MKFKVGDRVVCYDQERNFTDEIFIINPGNLVRFKHQPGVYHLKQCRKLARKKRREIWVDLKSKERNELGDWGYFKFSPPPDGWVKFVESKEKK